MPHVLLAVKFTSSEFFIPFPFGQRLHKVISPSGTHLLWDCRRLCGDNRRSWLPDAKFSHAASSSALGFIQGRQTPLREAQKRLQIIFRCLRPHRANPRRLLVKHRVEAGSIPSTKGPSRTRSMSPKERAQPGSGAGKGKDPFHANSSTHRKEPRAHSSPMLLSVPHVVSSPNLISPLIQTQNDQGEKG